MDTILTLKEDEIISLIKCELSKYQHYKSKFRVARKIHRRSRSACNLRILTSKPSDTVALCELTGSESTFIESFTPKIVRKNQKNMTTMVVTSHKQLLCKIYKDPQEVYGYLREYFLILHSKLLCIGGSATKNKVATIHISNVKQLFLDLHLLSNESYKKALKCMKGKVWVDLETLTNAMESIAPKLKFKSNHTIEDLMKQHASGLIFFFRFFQTLDENDLSLEDVELALKIVLRAYPIQMIKSFIVGLSQRINKSVVSFSDFYKFILN